MDTEYILRYLKINKKNAKYNNHQKIISYNKIKSNIELKAKLLLVAIYII